MSQDVDTSQDVDSSRIISASQNGDRMPEVTAGWAQNRLHGYGHDVPKYGIVPSGFNSNLISNAVAGKKCAAVFF